MPELKANDPLNYANFAVEFLEQLAKKQESNLKNACTALPLMLKANQDANLVLKMNSIGLSAKNLGRAGKTLTTVSVLSDTKSFINDEIGVKRYSYRMSGTVAGIFASSKVGGYAGLTVGLATVSGEMLYDLGSWVGSEMQKAVGDIEAGLKNGWVPGR